MSAYNLHITDIYDLRQSTRLVQMICNPGIVNIRYIWDGHTCDYSPHFNNTLLLRDHRLAIVKFEIGQWLSLKQFLIAFNEILEQNGVLEEVYRQAWAHKAYPGRMFLCIC